MKHGFFRTQWFVYALLHGLLFIPLNWVDARADMRIISPADGATVLGQVSVSTSPSYWTDLYIDGDYLTSGPPFTSSWDSTSVADGAHTISVMGFDTSGTPSSYASMNVAVANDSGLGVMHINSPGNGSSVSGSVSITTTSSYWTDLYIDGNYLTSGPPFTNSWDSTSVGDGTHTISVTGFRTSGAPSGSAAVQVIVANHSPGGGGPTGIPGLTGSAAGIAGADTNPNDYGHYNAPGASGAGYNLIGGPLLDDTTAAQFVIPAAQSSIETGSTGPDNAAANKYFENTAVPNSSGYLTALQSFWSAYQDSGWQAEIERVDGACPMANPTTAEVLQWAANKWGINPILLYAEATADSHFDQTSLGDWSGGIGCSSGICQIADRNTSDRPNHAWPGFDGAGADLARENTCFNADFYAAHLYSAFHGLTGETPAGDIGTAIQSWMVGSTSTPGSYTTETYNDISSLAWQARFFGSDLVPY